MQRDQGHHHGSGESGRVTEGNARSASPSNRAQGDAAVQRIAEDKTDLHTLVAMQEPALQAALAALTAEQQRTVVQTAWNKYMPEPEDHMRQPVFKDQPAGLTNVMTDLFHLITGDAQTLTQIAEVRFRKIFNWGASLHNDPFGPWNDSARVWDEAALRKVWAVLESLPLDDVQGNSRLDKLHGSDTTGGVGGQYVDSNQDAVDLAINRNQLDAKYTNNTVGTVGADQLDHATRHEVGHAVDEKLGFMKAHHEKAEWGSWKYHAAADDAYAYYAGKAAAVIGNAAAKPVIEKAIEKAMEGKQRGDISAHLAADKAGAAFAHEPVIATLQAMFPSRPEGRTDDYYSRPQCGGAIGDETVVRVHSTDGPAYASIQLSRIGTDGKLGVSKYQFKSPSEFFAEYYAAYYDTATPGELIQDPTVKQFFDGHFGKKKQP